MNLTTLFTRKVKLVGLIMLVFVGMWLMVTPFHFFLVETADIGPVESVIIGAIIVFIGIKVYKFKLW